eukprot:787849-Amphidinium_carterae.1
MGLALDLTMAFNTMSKQMPSVVAQHGGFTVAASELLFGWSLWSRHTYSLPLNQPSPWRSAARGWGQ